MTFDWKSVVRTVAPTIASAFGTPLAGLGVSAILNAILPPDAPKPADPEAYLATSLQAATPDMLLKIKQAEQQFILDMRSLDISEEKMGDEDRANARGREIAVHDNTPKILAYLLTVGFFSILALLIFHGVPESSRDIVNILIGSLGTAWIGFMVYYSGSSAGSAAKQALIGALMKPPTP
jgi:hypothetical protein